MHHDLHIAWPAVARQEWAWEGTAGLAEVRLSWVRLGETATQAGRLIGLCDFRPSYGRFRVEQLQQLVD